MSPIMDMAAVVTARCQGCGACLLTCPEHAIRPGHAVRADQAVRAGPAPLSVVARRCTGCGECVEVCPVDAIDMVVCEGLEEW